jgi:amidohydrolase
LDVESIKSLVIEEVEAYRDELYDLSRKIHDNPELGFHETKASAWLTAILQKNGFKVERGIYGLPTAFRAIYGQGRPVVALLAEYDALPDLGHGCGHNLIATSSVGGGIAARKAVDRYGGCVVVMGTPAEELYGGKVTMAQGGAFSELDAAMMVHPGNHDSVVTEALALQGLNVEFFGKASHAAAKPEEGINALEAVILSFNAINSLRQHIKSSARVHGIITDGGQAPNIVPAHTAASFMVRATDQAYLEELKQKVLDCFKGAAAATGARLEYKWDDLSYAPLLNNLTLGKLFLANLRRFRKKAQMEDPDKGFGSTDFGNVSQLIPGIHASIAIAPRGVVTHSPQFAEAAGSETGRQAMLDAAKALALTVTDLLADPELIVKAREEFNQHQE